MVDDTGSVNSNHATDNVKKTSSSTYMGAAIEAIFSFLWLIPMLAVWIIYLIICLICKG